MPVHSIPTLAHGLPRHSLDLICPDFLLRLSRSSLKVQYFFVSKLVRAQVQPLDNISGIANPSNCKDALILKTCSTSGAMILTYNY